MQITKIFPAVLTRYLQCLLKISIVYLAKAGQTAKNCFANIS